MAVGPGGVRWERQGAAEVHIDPERLTGVRRERGMAGKWVGQNRLVVVTWRADDGSEFATGFLPRRQTDVDASSGSWWRRRRATAPSRGSTVQQRPSTAAPVTAARPPHPAHPGRRPVSAVSTPSAQPIQQQSRLVEREPAVLVLEDGRTFRGESYGALGETVGEAVFSTGMTGYQETLTDPSYHRQVVVMTAPHVGNTGVNDEDDESRRIWVAGYVVRDPALRPSSWRSQRSLEDELRRPGRRRHLRGRHPRADPAPA